MSDLFVEKSLLPLIESQFPAFYQEEGPLFIAFVKEYFKWLESNYLNIDLRSSTDFNIGDTVTQNTATGIVEGKVGNTIYVKVTSTQRDFKCLKRCSNSTPIVSTSGGNTLIETTKSNSPTYYIRRLPEYNDIDKTADAFINQFKDKYLNGVNLNSSNNKKRAIKASTDLYKSKGSELSVDLLFKLVYNTGAEVYTPSENILMPSNGTWVNPFYLEITKSPRNIEYVNKTITGTDSGASAIVEDIITRNIDGRFIDVLTISNVVGAFEVGESITYDKDQRDAPKVLGSLSSVNIVFPGNNFVAGEELRITSEFGSEGLGVVAGVNKEAGLVGFNLKEGGWGYSSGIYATVSSKVLDVANVSSTFFDLEQIVQPLTEYVLVNPVGEIEREEFVTNVTETGNSFVVFASLQGSNNTIVVNNLTGNLDSYPGSGPRYEKMIRSRQKQWIAVNTSADYFLGEVVRQQNTSSANVSLGVLTEKELVTIVTVSSYTSGNVTPGNYVVQNSTKASGYVEAIPWTDYAAYANLTYFAISNTTGIFSNTDYILAYSNATSNAVLGNTVPSKSQLGYLLKLKEVKGERWYPGNTIIGDTTRTTLTPIFVADVGGYVNLSTDATATGNLMATNATSIGLINVVNTFYRGTSSLIRGASSSCNASIVEVSTGVGANAKIGLIKDIENIRVPSDFLSGNNFYGIKYANIFLSGANSNTANGLTNVIIFDGGSGYDNSHVVVFAGGNTSSGTQAGNASIVTDGNGSITTVTLSANIGTYFSSTPNVEIRDSSNNLVTPTTAANLTPTFSLGFPKNVLGTIETTLLSLFSYSNVEVGSILSLTDINTGADYSVTPFVRITNPSVAEYGLGTYILQVSNVSSSFVRNEIITQTQSIPSTNIVSNAAIGNTNFDIGELVVSTDGIIQIANGFVETSNVSSNAGNNITTLVINNSGTFKNTITTSYLSVNTNVNFSNGNLITQGTANGILVNSNTSTLIVRQVSGTFAANSTAVTSNSGGSALISFANNNYKIYTLRGTSSNCTSTIISSNTITYQPVAKAKVQEYIAANGYLKATPYSLRTTFSTGVGILGDTSAATANVDFITYVDPDAGDNATIGTTVTSNSGIAGLSVTSSGFGYINGAELNITSMDNKKTASGIAVVGGIGKGTSGYIARSGFLNDYDKLHDGEYYQYFSYEVQSSLPLAKYFDMLKEVLHVAGTRLFGKYKSYNLLDVTMNVSNSSITIT